MESVNSRIWPILNVRQDDLTGVENHFQRLKVEQLRSRTAALTLKVWRRADY